MYRFHEMPHNYAAFHLGLHCLPKCSIKNHQYTKGLINVSLLVGDVYFLPLTGSYFFDKLILNISFESLPNDSPRNVKFQCSD